VFWPHLADATFKSRGVALDLDVILDWTLDQLDYFVSYENCN